MEPVNKFGMLCEHGLTAGFDLLPVEHLSGWATQGKHSVFTRDSSQRARRAAEENGGKD